MQHTPYRTCCTNCLEILAQSGTPEIYLECLPIFRIALDKRKLENKAVSKVRPWVDHPGIQLNLALCDRGHMQPFNQYILVGACTHQLTCVGAHSKVCRGPASTCIKTPARPPRHAPYGTQCESALCHCVLRLKRERTDTSSVHRKVRCNVLA